MSISDLHTDTSFRRLKDTDLHLLMRSKTKPLSDLVNFLETLTGIDVLSSMSLLQNPNNLNMLCRLLHHHIPISFASEDDIKNDERYYEQIIFDTKCVPTRTNWHDFFNGLIWCQFPKTKHYFNARHIKDMATQKSKSRTAVRDRITHFDECGIVLFTNQKELKQQLQEHKWQSVFVENKTKWHKQTVPVIFGHALWEMLLAPFIGLTAKATVIELDAVQMQNMRLSKNQAEFYAFCDDLLVNHLITHEMIDKPKPWSPLPLLGIPNWSPFPQTQSFYSNADYFMPKRC